jgi:hypothetical protein
MLAQERAAAQLLWHLPLVKLWRESEGTASVRHVKRSCKLVPERDSVGCGTSGGLPDLDRAQHNLLDD